MLKETKAKILGIEGWGQMKEAWAGDLVGVLLDVKLENIKRGDIIIHDNKRTNQTADDRAY